MEIIFCMDRVIGEKEATEIANELRCTTPTLEGYFCCKDDASTVGDAQDLIEYRIESCPAMAGLYMNEKMDKIISVFKKASEKAIGIEKAPVWVHLYYGVIKQELYAYVSWMPKRYLTQKAMDKLNF